MGELEGRRGDFWIAKATLFATSASGKSIYFDRNWPKEQRVA